MTRRGFSPFGGCWLWSSEWRYQSCYRGSWWQRGTEVVTGMTGNRAEQSHDKFTFQNILDELVCTVLLAFSPTHTYIAPPAFLLSVNINVCLQCHTNISLVSRTKPAKGAAESRTHLLKTCLFWPQITQERKWKCNYMLCGYFDLIECIRLET